MGPPGIIAERPQEYFGRRRAQQYGEQVVNLSLAIEELGLCPEGGRDKALLTGRKNRLYCAVLNLEGPFALIILRSYRPGPRYRSILAILQLIF